MADADSNPLTRNCPCCVAELQRFGPLEALALGAALGAAAVEDRRGDGAEGMHAVTKLCCVMHRMTYARAMVRAMVGVNSEREIGGRNG